MEKIQDLLSEIPHAWHDRADPGGYEAWYAGLLYMSFRTMQVELKAEEMTSHGRSDMVLLHQKQVFVLELKMVENKAGAEKALKVRLHRFVKKAMQRSIGTARNRFT